jgi:hypothetical protein
MYWLCLYYWNKRKWLTVVKPYWRLFDIDYVAHEIGHQMGGYHKNNSLKSGNNTEKPGSGSSIMACWNLWVKMYR